MAFLAALTVPQLIFGGIAVAGFIYSMTRTGPTIKLNAPRTQSAKEGEPIRIVWGVSRPFAGTLVACQEPPRIVSESQGGGGKGGGGSSSPKVQVPYRTYAVLLCEGPIDGIRRVWRNSKLVYDGRPDSAWGASNNGVFLQKFRFYLGDYDQLPDPSLESIFGVGGVPAMRGRAYMVAVNERLQDTGGAVPQWNFEVYRKQKFVYLTSEEYTNSFSNSPAYTNSFSNSPAYDTYFEDEGILSGDARDAYLYEMMINNDSTEGGDLTASVQSLNLVQVVNPVDLIEGGDLTGSIQSTGLVQVVKPADATEGGDLTASVQSVDLQVVVLQYNVPVEGGDLTASVQSVALETV